VVRQWKGNVLDFGKEIKPDKREPETQKRSRLAKKHPHPCYLDIREKTVGEPEKREKVCRLAQGMYYTRKSR